MSTWERDSEYTVITVCPLQAGDDMRGAAQVEAPTLEDLRLVVMVELHLPAVNTIHHQRILID